MRQYHKTPCRECPWRKTSLKGYLGGHDPEYYADAVRAGVVTACHLQDFGPEDNRTAFCAGAASTLANCATAAAESESGQTGAKAFRNAVGKRDDTFWHPSLFYEYHAGRPYVHPLLRKLEDHLHG